jgi:hypothetical protein
MEILRLYAPMNYYILYISISHLHLHWPALKFHWKSMNLIIWSHGESWLFDKGIGNWGNDRIYIIRWYEVILRIGCAFKYFLYSWRT